MASISFQCSSCKRSIKANEDKAGKKMKCPECGAVTSVPSAAPAPAVSAAADDDDAKAYGLVDIVDPNQSKEAPKKKAKKKAAPAIQVRRAKLADADQWAKVNVGLLFFMFGFGVWGLWTLTQLAFVGMGYLSYPDYAGLVEAATTPAPAPGEPATIDRLSVLIGVVSFGSPAIGRTLLLVGSIALLAAGFLWLMGYFACLAVPERFGSRGQVLMLLLLCPVNLLLTAVLRLLPLAGIYNWAIAPLVVPEVALTLLNLERVTPLHVFWSRYPFIETFAATLVLLLLYLEPILISIFAWTCALCIRERKVEESCMGLVRMGFGVFFIYYCFVLISLAGTSSVLISVLRVTYLLFAGFQIGYIIRALLVFNKLRTVMGVYLSDADALAKSRSDDDEDDEDDDEEDDDDDD